MKLKLVENTGASMTDKLASDAPRTPIEKLADRLRIIFPLTEVRTGSRGLTVMADGTTGFPVTLELMDDTVAVSFGPGMIEFDCVEAAFKHAILACSSETRLTVVRRGNRAKSWHLEALEPDGTWQGVFAGGSTLFGGETAGPNDEVVVMRNGRSIPVMTALSYGLPTARTAGPAA
jgi:hypothetical protein